MVSRMLALVGIAVAMFAAACSGTGSSSSEARIVFVSQRDGNPEIYVMDTSGGNVTRLTDTAQAEDSPTWSPAADKIAFRRTTEDGGSQFWVMNADGSNERLIAETEVVSPPLTSYSWSPDGSQLALRLNIAGVSGAHIANADGTGVRELNTDSVLVVPSWSPVDDHILLRIGITSPTLATVLPDGGDLVELTDDGMLAAWSPDASRIVFISSRDGNSEVYVMNSDGSGLVNVSQSEAKDGPNGVVWSPDGTRFAFYSDDGEEDHLTMANADGSGLTLLASPDIALQITQIVWSPDSERIAFVARLGDLSAPGEILIVNTDGSGLANVSQTPSQEERIFGWSPDSERILFVGDPPLAAQTSLSAELYIYSIDADGSNLKVLTEEGPDSHDQAALSSGE